jgi:hypothetical protein
MLCAPAQSSSVSQSARKLFVFRVELFALPRCITMAAHPAEVYESFSIFLQPGDGLPSRVQFGQCMVGTQASAVVTLTTQSTKHTDGSHKGTEITVHIHNKNATNHQFLQAAPVCLGHSPTCPARLAHDERYRTQNKIAAPGSFAEILLSHLRSHDFLSPIISCLQYHRRSRRVLAFVLSSNT